MPYSRKWSNSHQQQRHIEAPVERNTARSWRCGAFDLEKSQLIDCLAIQGLEPGTVCVTKLPPTSGPRSLRDTQQPGFAIKVVQCGNGDTGPLQMGQHIGEGQFCDLSRRAAHRLFGFSLNPFRVGKLRESAPRAYLQSNAEIPAIGRITRPAR